MYIWVQCVAHRLCVPDHRSVALRRTVAPPIRRSVATVSQPARLKVVGPHSMARTFADWLCETRGNKTQTSNVQPFVAVKADAYTLFVLKYFRLNLCSPEAVAKLRRRVSTRALDASRSPCVGCAPLTGINADATATETVATAGGCSQTCVPVADAKVDAKLLGLWYMPLPRCSLIFVRNGTAQSQSHNGRRRVAEITRCLVCRCSPYARDGDPFRNAKCPLCVWELVCVCGRRNLKNTSVVLSTPYFVRRRTCGGAEEMLRAYSSYQAISDFKTCN